MVDVVEGDGTEAVCGSHSMEGASGGGISLAGYSKAAGVKLTEAMGKGTTEIVDSGIWGVMTRAATSLPDTLGVKRTCLPVAAGGEDRDSEPVGKGDPPNADPWLERLFRDLVLYRCISPAGFQWLGWATVGRREMTGGGKRRETRDER